MPLYSFDFSRAPYPFGPDTRACGGLVGLGVGGGVREIYCMCVCASEHSLCVCTSEHSSAPPAPVAEAPKPAAAL